METIQNQVKTFNAFSKEVGNFISEAKNRQTSENDWFSFKIENITKMLQANDFRLIIANIMHGGDYYFSPEHIEIITETSPEYLAKAKLESPTMSEKKDAFGSKVILNIKGEYLVAKKRQ
ncbi:MAG: hypothetical protein H7833_09225 [Magnetococcus sp. DMHC-1]